MTSELAVTVHLGDDPDIFGRTLGSTGNRAMLCIDDLHIYTKNPAILEAIADTAAKTAVELRRAQQRKAMQADSGAVA